MNTDTNESAHQKNGHRHALITGAAGGLGFAIARHLASLGHPVILLDADERVQERVRLLREEGASARAIVLDITDEAALARLPSLLGADFERLAILVNNAGISPKHEGRKHKVSEMAASEWRRVLEVNLTGSFLMTQACLPALCRQGWGRVVMITSQAARTRTPVPGAHYQASKSGLTGLARVLAAEVAEFGVTVNCVAPGRITTDMTDAVDPAANAALAALIPLGRLGHPHEVAATVGFLVSEGASYLTGATLDVNGGNHMA